MVKLHVRLRKPVIYLTLFAVTCQLFACGTIFYPERRGQPAGRIDPTVVVMDGLGLLLFFVPGVVAFAVDFATGAIYLPPEHYGQTSSESFDPKHSRVIHVPPSELSREKIEQVVQEQTGERVVLEPGSYQAARLDNLEDAIKLNQLSPDGNAAAPSVVDVRFRAQSGE